MAGKRTCGDETFCVDMKLLFCLFVCFGLFVCLFVFFGPKSHGFFVDEGNLFSDFKDKLTFFEVRCLRFSRVE